MPGTPVAVRGGSRAALFQPEPAGVGSRPHAVIRPPARAAVAHATERVRGSV
ncbi:MAG: hypothetical protein JF597_13750 [Streptomyces sp.]|uniref:hypothetical protein n=1 Tax=Streptomyces sp. TaxID=1931 RepID=UPI0025DE3875|nr:hypothetical protein [Streptomyces sp.]MBW8794620.1 hypothetical protein [Streptomyces sp.]